MQHPSCDGFRRKCVLLETTGKRDPDDVWPRRHLWNRRYQPPDCLESPKHAVVRDLASLIGEPRWIAGCRLGFDLGSLGLAVNRVIAIDLSTDPLVPDFFAEISKSGDAPEEVKEFVQNKVAQTLPITMASSLFTRTKENLRQGQPTERDVLRDAYFVAAIWGLLGQQIVQREQSPESHLALGNAV